MIKIRFEEYRTLDGQLHFEYYENGTGIYVAKTMGPGNRLYGADIKTRRRTRTFLNARGFIKWNTRHVKCKWNEERLYQGCIKLSWTYDDTHGILLHEVEDTRRGILFSDGAYTRGAKYECDEFINLMAECAETANDCSNLKFCNDGGRRRSTYEERA